MTYDSQTNRLRPQRNNAAPRVNPHPPGAVGTTPSETSVEMRWSLAMCANTGHPLAVDVPDTTSEGVVFRWSGACWDVQSHERLASQALAWLSRYAADKANRRVADSCAATLPLHLRREDAKARLPVATAGSDAWIGMLDHDLHIAADGTLQAVPHDPAHGITALVQARLRTHAIAPDGTYTPADVPPDSLFGRYLARFLPDPGDACMVQEAVASSLIPTTFEQLFLLIGSGANGKSTILHLLNQLHAGSSQASDLDTLLGRWWGEALLGKTLLTVSELPDYIDKNGCQRLKQLASRDAIYADRKNRSGFTYRPQATLFLASNHPVRWQDTSTGMMRKVTTLVFSQRIQESEMIRDYNVLITRDPDEMAIVVDWALAGVQRLIRNSKQFSAPSKASVTMREENALASSAVLAWIHDCDVSRDDHTWTNKVKIFGHFNRWCLRNNRKGQVDATFWREIRTRLFDGAPLAELRQRTREGRVRCVNLRIDAPDTFESIETIDDGTLF